MVLIAIGSVITLAGGYSLVNRINNYKYMQQRADAIKTAQEVIHKPIIDKKTLQGAGIMSGGVGALSLYEIYQSVEKHEEVLNVLEHRFPNVLREFDGSETTISWLNKLSELNTKGENSLGAYVNAYKGEMGEIKTIETLEREGYHAEQFESLTHPNDDIQVFDKDGNHIKDVSVKSYGDEQQFFKVVSEHPESTSYSVNTELYQKLESKGLIEDYADKGIEIFNGGFSNTTDTLVAEEAFGEIIGSADTSSQSPIILAVMLAWKAGNHINDYMDEKKTGTEFTFDMASDATKAATVFVSGGVVGSAIGSIIPGIGTFIGGTIGVYASSIIAHTVVGDIFNYFKYGSIIEAIEHFGKKIDENEELIKKDIAETIFAKSSLKSELKKQNKLTSKYNTNFDLLGSEPITLEGVLIYTHKRNLQNTVDNINKAIKNGLLKLKGISTDRASKIAKEDIEKEKKLFYRYYGEAILSSRDIFPTESFVKSDEEREILESYYSKKESIPNHPYRLLDSVSQEDLVRDIFYSELRELSLNKNDVTVPSVDYSIFEKFLILLLGLALIYFGV